MNTKRTLQAIRPGDAVLRVLGGMPMQLLVTAVDDGFIYCGSPNVGWKFDRETGIEVDEEIRWGPQFGVSGSYLLPPNELELDLRRSMIDRTSTGSGQVAIPPRVRFRTETGSTYEIDNVDLSWVRASATPASGELRSESGRLVTPVAPEVGFRAMLVCPPFQPGLGPRVVVTSSVVELDSDPEAPRQPKPRRQGVRQPC